MDVLDNLNSAQQQAVTADLGPTLVLAGPGSGKTRVITRRVAYRLQQGDSPRSVLAVTFTNKAAREMRDRVEALVGEVRGLTIGTFHSVCARLLRIEGEHIGYDRNFIIYDSSDQEALVKSVMNDLQLDEKRFKPRILHGKIGRAKNELIDPKAFKSETYFDEVAGRVYEEYQAALRRNNAMDFDDLLMQVVVLLREHPQVAARYQRRFSNLMIDEFQDTNTAQYELARLLSGVHRSLFVVGDEDQSIYRWRGADYRNVRRFREDYPDAHVILLERNYRSTQNVLDAAMGVIRRNKDRTHKDLFTDRSGGATVYVHEAYDDREEAGWIVDRLATIVMEDDRDPGEFAIMYRTNSQSRAIEDAFVRRSLPYKLVGATRFYARREVKDLLAFLRLTHNPADTVALYRIINTPTRGIGQKTVDTLAAVARQVEASPVDILLALAERGKESPYGGHFKGRSLGALADFGETLAGWLSQKETRSVVQLIDLILDTTEFHAYLNDGTREGEERWENVMELRNVANGFDDLSVFLEEVSLVSDVDNLGEEGSAPTLLTLHASKGLEFPVVFIVGLDEGTLPHQRSLDDPEELAEERRLLYVGLTRAKDQAILTRAHRRSGFGETTVSTPSRFLADIPANLLDGYVTPAYFTGQTARERMYRRQTAWSTNDTPAQQRTRHAAPVLTYKVGQRVKHPMFGEGTVIESRVLGGDEIVSVAFGDRGLKRLSAALAELTVLSD